MFKALSTRSIRRVSVQMSSITSPFFLSALRLIVLTSADSAAASLLVSLLIFCVMVLFFLFRPHLGGCYFLFVGGETRTDDTRTVRRRTRTVQNQMFVLASVDLAVASSAASCDAHTHAQPL